MFHGDNRPFFLFMLLVQQLRSDLIMAIGKDMGLDYHLLSDCSFDGEAAAVDLRSYIIDDHAFSANVLHPAFALVV
jgi:hypothetical protein